MAGFLLLLCTPPMLIAELHLKEADVERSAGVTPSGWRQDWAVEEGFSVSIDTEGYHYPSAIAFVPNPGPRPKDPLYFVTELRGKVKVVTNDRTVHTFAEGFLHTDLDEEPPAGDGETGLAGICLAPEQGYVFITFAYPLDDGTLRNNIIRFETRPRTFALKPRSQQAFTKVLAAYESGLSHQIGGCQISNEMLYVGIGDGFKSHLDSQRLDALLGKMVRMTLDGKPVAANPFYVDDDIHRAANYVWAYGLRNPFSLNVIDDRVIVTENGIEADRFLELHRGTNYLWDGTDRSITANADYVFEDSVGPVQMDYYRGASPAFPAGFRDQFYVAVSDKFIPGIMRIPYSLEDNRMRAIPKYMLRYVGEPPHPVVGLAFGPDGLYFTPILPVRNGQGAVLKIRYEPRGAYPVSLEDAEASDILSMDGKELMISKGCFGCHQVLSARPEARGGNDGPVLGDEAMVERIQQRTKSSEFVNALKKLNARDEASQDRWDQARNDVLEAQGLERVKLYIKYQILEPSFDGPRSAMPDLNVDEAEAEAIARFLLSEADPNVLAELKERVLGIQPRYLAASAFGAGALFGLSIWFAQWLLARLLAGRRHASSVRER